MATASKKKTATVEKAEETQVITKQEQALIEQARANDKRRKDCSDAIIKVLEEFRCDIVVNPNSPVGKPSIMLQLLQ